jgi:hypothetical protein
MTAIFFLVSAIHLTVYAKSFYRGRLYGFL